MRVDLLMTRRSLRYAVFASCCIALMPLLTSCFFGDPDYAINPATISREGDSLLIAVCTDVRFTDVRIEARGFPANWKEVFVATGDAELKAGDIFSPEDSIPGLITSIAGSPDFNVVNQLIVVLSDSHTKSPVSSTSFSTPEGGVPVGKWLHWGGEITEKPCPG